MRPFSQCIAGLLHLQYQLLYDDCSGFDDSLTVCLVVVFRQYYLNDHCIWTWMYQFTRSMYGCYTIYNLDIVCVVHPKAYIGGKLFWVKITFVFDVGRFQPQVKLHSYQSEMIPQNKFPVTSLSPSFLVVAQFQPHLGFNFPTPYFRGRQ